MSLTFFFENFKSSHRSSCNYDFSYDFGDLLVDIPLKTNKLCYKYEDNTFNIFNDAFCFSTKDFQNISFVIDLNKIKNNEVSLGIDEWSNNFPKTFSNIKDYSKIDLKLFLNFKDDFLDKENLIFLKKEEKETRIIKMFLYDNIIKVTRTCTKMPKRDIIKRDCRKSYLKSFILLENIEIPFHEYCLAKTMSLLEENNIQYEFEPEIRCIPGHCIDIGCLKITGKDFILVFSFNSLLTVEITKNIANTSYFTTTKNKKYNLKEIMKREMGIKKYKHISGYGADDAWHRVSYRKKECGYSFGYTL